MRGGLVFYQSSEPGRAAASGWRAAVANAQKPLWFSVAVLKEVRQRKGVESLDLSGFQRFIRISR
jgi:hypothetical protein